MRRKQGISSRPRSRTASSFSEPGVFSTPFLYEPFFTQPEWKEKCSHNYDTLGAVLDWPNYGKVDYPDEYVRQSSAHYS